MSNNSILSLAYPWAVEVYCIYDFFDLLSRPMPIMGSTLRGSRAPNFTLLDQSGSVVVLENLLTERPMLLVFYPGDFTAICTRQLCSYRDRFAEFSRFGVGIVGVSPNPPESHREFRKVYGFSFPLLSDLDQKVFKSYGVTSLFMLGGISRAVFIISRSRTILYRHVEATSLTHRKPQELIQVLQELSLNGQL